MKTIIKAYVPETRHECSNLDCEECAYNFCELPDGECPARTLMDRCDEVEK